MDFRILTKSLFGRKRVAEEVLDVIDGEVIGGNKGNFQVEPDKLEDAFRKARLNPENQNPEPEFQEPEFIEPTPEPVPQEPEKTEPEDKTPWSVPAEYVVYMGASGKAERTIKEYQWDLSWWNRKKDIRTICRQDIERVINRMHPSTARRKIAVLRSYAKWKLREGDGQLYNEVSQIIPPKTPGRVPKDKGEEFFKKITTKAKELCNSGDRRGIWLGLMLCCGLRISEIQTVKLSSGNTIKVTGKGNKERLIPAPSWLLLAISKHYHHGNQWKQTRSLIWLELKKIKMRKPHSLRHTYASQLIRSGFSLEEVQKLLGHSKIDTTLVYAQVNLPDNVTTRLGVEN